MALETGCGIKALACGILWVVSRHSATVNIVNALPVIIGDDSSLSIKTLYHRQRLWIGVELFWMMMMMALLNSSRPTKKKWREASAQKANSDLVRPRPSPSKDDVAFARLARSPV